MDFRSPSRKIHVQNLASSVLLCLVAPGPLQATATDDLYATYGIQLKAACVGTDPNQRPSGSIFSPAVLKWLECQSDCGRYGINCRTDDVFPPTGIVNDWSHPISTADPSAPPVIINTCQDPISIALDNHGLTAGIASKVTTSLDGCQVASLGSEQTENFTTYGFIPYTLTCGNGLQVKGAITADLGNESVSDVGGCGKDRTPNWQTPGVASADADGYIHGIYMNYDDGRYEVGFGRGEKRRVPFDQILAEARNHTMTLPTYTGGERILPSPILFVHGLDVPYDETWGVKRPKCDPQGVEVDASVPQHLYAKLEVTPDAWIVHAQASLGFGGTCALDQSPRRWQSGLVDLFSLALPLTFQGDAEQGRWEGLWQNSPPTIDGLSVGNGLVKGVLHTWIQTDDATRSFPPGSLYSVTATDPATIAQFTDLGGNAFSVVRADLAFQVPLDGPAWNHSDRANAALPAVGEVSTDPTETAVYGSATAPDIISRIQRLKKGAGINRNGLYFFNGYRWKPDAKEGVGADVQPLPWWNNAGPEFPGQPGESWSLYQDLQRVLTAHYGEAWKTDPSLKLDLVAHSRGGISIREMLANAGGTDPFGQPMPADAANAANHIRKVVTVDTPHFGSIFTTSPQSMPSDYDKSQKRLVLDSAKFDLSLADVTVDPTFAGSLAAGYYTGNQTTSALVDYFYGGLHASDYTDWGQILSSTLTAPIWLPVGVLLDAGQALEVAPADIRFRMTGNWFWPKSVLATYEYPWGSKKIRRVSVDQDVNYNRTFSARKKGGHLAIDSAGIINLFRAYPTMPNGQDLELQTLHSTIGGLGDLIRDLLAKNLAGMCDVAPDLHNASCYGFNESIRYGWLVDDLVGNIKADLPLGTFLNDYSKGWFAKSDIAVQDESQQAVRAGTVWVPTDYPNRFHDPRTYALRRFLTGGRFPDSLAPHGGNLAFHFDTVFLGRRFSGNSDIIGAPLLGHDIYCALAPDCSDLLESGNGQVVRLPWQTQETSDAPAPASLGGAAMRRASLEVTGDFGFTALAKDTALLGISVSAPGETAPLLRVLWSPGGGVVVQKPIAPNTWWGGQQTVSQVLVPPGYAALPRVLRQGDSLVVVAKLWSGQQQAWGFRTPGLASTLQVAAQRPAGSDVLPLLVGAGSVDTANLNPRNDRQVRVWFWEARKSETAWSRPRIVIENTGRAPVVGISARYRFRADPAHPPVLEAPAGGPWHVEPQGGDLYDLVLSDSQVVVAPGGIWPAKAQNQVGLHMSDWTPWDVFKDPSNDRNYGLVRLNETIRVWDGSGALLYGRDVGAADPDRPRIHRILVDTREDAVGESNVSKPEIEVRNDGNQPIQGLTATWFTRFPVGKTPVLDTWTPSESQVSLQGLGGGLWAVKVKLDRWLQPGQKATGGSFGIHLPDWSAWDRSRAPSRKGTDGKWTVNPWVVVTDSQGVVLWGNLPRPQDVPLVSDSGSTGPGTGPGQPLDLLVELRDESPWEANTAKPRVRVTNQTAAVVNGFRLEFPVHPERNLVPVLDPYWVPGCQTSVEMRGTESDGILDCHNLSLAPGAVWPDPSGAVFALRYTDWSAWDKTDDPAFQVFTSSFAPAPGVRVLPVGP